MRSLLFVLKRLLVWGLGLGMVFGMVNSVLPRFPDWIFGIAWFATMVFVVVRSASHVRRVGLIAGRVDGSTLASRHRRHVEIPFPAEEAFALVDAAVRELPHVESVSSAPDSLQLRAQVKRIDPYLGERHDAREAAGRTRKRRNQVLATVTPGEGTSSLALICEPQGGVWVDWLLVDDGTNLENAEAITRAITRRVSERRKGEAAAVRDTAAGRELAEAKLSLLHAQVEPHFLYNTLASAQVLTRSDPAAADRMLGNLITYLRHSLPRTEDAFSTLGEELERTHAYLEIMKLRMGARLASQVQVPETLKGLRVPRMMLQTLVENAIKHGLEPVPGGGNLWVLAREADGKVSITVADDGRGFSDEGGGTGIGLKNLRERLRLAYGEGASFSIVANFPRGVAATVSLPRAGEAAVPAQ